MRNIFSKWTLPALILIILGLLVTSAAARVVNKNAASAAHNNAYILNDVQFPNLAQVLPQAPTLQSMQFEKDYRRLTYRPATSVDEEVNAYMVHLIREGYVLTPKRCWPDATVEQYLEMQFPDTVNNLFCNIKIEWDAETYTITLWLGTDLI